MKILQVLPALEQGGVERGTLEIASALVQAGIPNAVASAGGRMVKDLENLGVEHFTLPLDSKNPFVIMKNATKLARIASSGGFTLMHVRSRAPAWSVRSASAKSGVKFISTWHGLYGVNPKILKLPYNRIMLSGEKTIAVSNCVREHILSVYGADPAKVLCVHRGADTNIFYPAAVSETSVGEFKKTLGFPNDLPIISLPGRLTYWKGQKLLLEAASLMKSRPFGILFVGSDQGRREYSNELKALAGKLGESVKTVFLEHTSQMPFVYAASEVVLSASSAQPEAFGRVIPEAQAMGRLVVATAHGGACETVSDGVSGFLVPPGDVAAMAKKLDEVLALPDEVKQRVKSAAVESVRDNFSTQRMCEKTIDIYRELHHGY